MHHILQKFLEAFQKFLDTFLKSLEASRTFPEISNSFLELPEAFFQLPGFTGLVVQTGDRVTRSHQPKLRQGLFRLHVARPQQVVEAVFDNVLLSGVSFFLLYLLSKIPTCSARSGGGGASWLRDNRATPLPVPRYGLQEPQVHQTLKRPLQLAASRLEPVW